MEFFQFLEVRFLEFFQVLEAKFLEFSQFLEVKFLEFFQFLEVKCLEIVVNNRILLFTKICHFFKCKLNFHFPLMCMCKELELKGACEESH